MVATPLSRVLSPAPGVLAGGACVAHLGVARSAIVRLAPIYAALAELGVPQAIAGARQAMAGGPPDTLAQASSPELLERELDNARPALALVAGDGEQAVAATLVASAQSVPIARLGAGLRSGDPTDRAEINRIVLDELADVLFVDSEAAAAQLREEGFPEDRIACVGSTVPDVVLRWRSAAERRPVPEALGVAGGSYVLVTLHEPENVGDEMRAARIVGALGALARRCPVVLCLPAREGTLHDLARGQSADMIVTDALDYLDFLSLETFAAAVLTDSAGVQEETTVLGVPCFTLARVSERLLTLTHGTNSLLGDDPADIAEIVIEARDSELIPLWDGRAGQRVAAWLTE
jgi:UDP-N-acetylglucosamine 2-epimerase (non-hydrolysing)